MTSGKPLDPLEALQFYLDSRDDLQDMSTDLMAAAESLLGYRLAERSPQDMEGEDDNINIGDDSGPDNDVNNGVSSEEGAREFVPVTQADLDTIPMEQLNLL